MRPHESGERQPASLMTMSLVSSVLKQIMGYARVANAALSRKDAQIIVKTKDMVAIAGIAVTLLVSLANLLYSLWSNTRASFVNTVTASRLKWIDSLRDKVSEFIAVTTRLSDRRPPPGERAAVELLLQRDTLLHQIVLHLNPHDSEDQRIKKLVDEVRALTDQGTSTKPLTDQQDQLRDATADYLKKEWNRVKTESTKGKS
jgi:hypothetical protein